MENPSLYDEWANDPEWTTKNEEIDRNEVNLNSINSESARQKSTRKKKPKKMQAHRDDGWEFVAGVGAGVLTSGVLLCTPLAATAGTFALWHSVTVAACSRYLDTSPWGVAGWLVSPVVVPVGAAGLGAIGAAKLAKMGVHKARELGCQFIPANCCPQHFTEDAILTGYHFWCNTCEHAVCIHCSRCCHSGEGHSLSAMRDGHYRCGCQYCSAPETTEQEVEGWQSIEWSKVFKGLGVPKEDGTVATTNGTENESAGDWVFV